MGTILDLTAIHTPKQARDAMLDLIIHMEELEEFWNTEEDVTVPEPYSTPQLWSVRADTGLQEDVTVPKPRPEVLVEYDQGKYTSLESTDRQITTIVRDTLWKLGFPAHLAETKFLNEVASRLGEDMLKSTLILTRSAWRRSTSGAVREATFKALVRTQLDLRYKGVTDADQLETVLLSVLKKHSPKQWEELAKVHRGRVARLTGRDIDGLWPFVHDQILLQLHHKEGVYGNPYFLGEDDRHRIAEGIGATNRAWYRVQLKQSNRHYNGVY